MRIKKFNKIILAGFLFFFLCLFADNLFASETQLTGISVNNTGGQTQVSLNLSNATSYKVFSLDSPNRIVIDLKSTQLATNTDSVDLGNAPILKIRHGHPAPDTYRIVLDIKKPLKYTATLNTNNLLVILNDGENNTSTVAASEGGIFANPALRNQTTSTAPVVSSNPPVNTATNSEATAPAATTNTTTALETRTNQPHANLALQQTKKWEQENIQQELAENSATQANNAGPAPLPSASTAPINHVNTVVTTAPHSNLKPISTIRTTVNNTNPPASTPAQTQIKAASNPIVHSTPPALATNRMPNQTVLPAPAISKEKTPPANTINANLQAPHSVTMATAAPIAIVPAKKLSPIIAAAQNPPPPTKTSAPAVAPTVAAATTPVTTIITAPPTSGNKILTIVIDPGHGGKDPGTTGSFGVREKDVVLAISKDLYAILEKQPGYRPVLTRNGDYFIPLRGRLAIARQDHADMFIAIHADAYSDSYATGASVYALSAHGASSEAARWLAEKENYSELGGVTLTDKSDLLRSVLIDLSQTATISSSIQLGTNLLSQLNMVGGLHHNVVEQAPFMVLKSPDIPSVLVETGFLSSPSEEERLHNPIHQEEIALALAKGIEAYFWNNPPPGSLVSALKTSKDPQQDLS